MRESRKILRIQGFDYSKPGYYFITICCHRGLPLFGKVSNGIMILNEAGKVANECWLAIPEHFPNVVLEDFVIMPNHVHGLIKIMDGDIKSDITKHEFGKVIPKSVASIVRGFKIGVTKWFRSKSDSQTIWHRSYHCSIVNSQAAENINRYIKENPARYYK